MPKPRDTFPSDCDWACLVGLAWFILLASIISMIQG
jgi:hypothetical protein